MQQLLLGWALLPMQIIFKKLDKVKIWPGLGLVRVRSLTMPNLLTVGTKK